MRRNDPAMARTSAHSRSEADGLAPGALQDEHVEAARAGGIGVADGQDSPV